MGQTRLGSWIESWANVAIGFAINWSANMLIFPFFGFHITAGQAFHVGIIFTIISVARSYVLRRVFNKIKGLHHVAAH